MKFLFLREVISVKHSEPNELIGIIEEKNKRMLQLVNDMEPLKKSLRYDSLRFETIHAIQGMLEHSASIQAEAITRLKNIPVIV